MTRGRPTGPGPVRDHRGPGSGPLPPTGSGTIADRAGDRCRRPVRDHHGPGPRPLRTGSGTAVADQSVTRDRCRRSRRAGRPAAGRPRAHRAAAAGEAGAVPRDTAPGARPGEAGRSGGTALRHRAGASRAHAPHLFRGRHDAAGRWRRGNRGPASARGPVTTGRAPQTRRRRPSAPQRGRPPAPAACRSAGAVRRPHPVPQGRRGRRIRRSGHGVADALRATGRRRPARARSRSGW